MRERWVRLRVVWMVGCLGLVGGCTTTAPWPAFHANGPNDGLVSIASELALIPKWATPVGQVGFGSPVIGREGKVFVGTLAGELVTVKPNGTIDWRRTPAAGATILGSPGVDQEGNVYVVAVNADKRASRLFKYDPAGNVICSAPLPGAVSSSPKSWGVDQNLYVMVLTPQSRLVAFDRTCRQVVDEHVCGGIVEGGSTGTKPNPDYVPPPYPDPTVAVITHPAYATPTIPLLVVAHRNCVRAFRWAPPTLSGVWDRDLGEERLATSPTFLGLGVIMIGFDDGYVRAYDPSNGAPMWEFDADAFVVGTPAGVFFNAYIVSENELVFLNAFDGSVVNRIPVPPPTRSSAAVTLNRVYLGTPKGFLSTPLGFEYVAMSPLGPQERSSPAVADDGSIYIVSGIGNLVAYPGRDR